jgi:hypothetical protein
MLFCWEPFEPSSACHVQQHLSISCSGAIFQGPVSPARNQGYTDTDTVKTRVLAVWTRCFLKIDSTAFNPHRVLHKRLLVCVYYRTGCKTRSRYYFRILSICLWKLTINSFNHKHEVPCKLIELLQLHQIWKSISVKFMQSIELTAPTYLRNLKSTSFSQ